MSQSGTIDSSTIEFHSNIIKCGWVKKKLKFNLINPWCDRYLCLTKTSIMYYHSDIHMDSEQTADCKIPLNAIKEVSIADVSHSYSIVDGHVQNIMIVIDSGNFMTQLLLQCYGIHEGTSWVQHILKARDLYIASVHNEKNLKVIWRRPINKSIRGNIERVLHSTSNINTNGHMNLLTEAQLRLLIKYFVFIADNI